MIARLEGLLRSRRARLVGALVSVGLLALLLLQLGRLWGESDLSLATLDWPVLALAVAASALALTASGAMWGQSLRALGCVPPRGLVAAFYVGQLAKYLPGGVWQYVGRAGLASRLGVPLRTASASLGLETLGLLVALVPVVPLVLADDLGGGALALAVAGLVLAGVLALGRWRWATTNARRLLARAAGAGTPVRLAPARTAVAGYVGCWLLFGVAFWITANGLVDAPPSDLPVYVGAFAIAWGAGFVAVFAPGGIGVREAVLVALLGPRIGAAEAIVVAAGSRIAFTLVDLAGGLAGLWVLRRRTTPGVVRAG